MGNTHDKDISDGLLDKSENEVPDKKIVLKQNILFLKHCQDENLYELKILYGLGNIKISYKHMIKACLYNHLEVAQWLNSLTKFNDDVKNNSIFSKLCYDQFTELITWWNTCYHVSIDTYNTIFIQCFKTNKLQTIKVLYDMNYILQTRVWHEFNIFNDCLNLEMLQWLHTKKDDRKIRRVLNYDKYVRYVSYISCEYGKLDIIKWLFEIGLLDQSTCIHKLGISITHGHLVLSKYLYDVITDKSQIKFYHLLNIACSNGYIEIAEWLCELRKPDISKIQISNILGSKSDQKIFDLLNRVFE